MSENDRVRLRHMLDAAREALAFVSDRKRPDIEADRMMALALVKEIEIIGEAAGRISEECKATQPQIPWSKAIGMRHRLVHAYFEIDFDILWATVTDALPPLIDALEGLLAETD